MEIHNYLKRRCGLDYDPDKETLVTVGGSEAIDIAMRAMLDPGDEVLVPQPSFVSYVPCTILAGGVAVPIALEEKDQFRLTPEKLLEKIKTANQGGAAKAARFYVTGAAQSGGGKLGKA